MFFPSALLYKNTVLSRLFIFACARRKTAKMLPWTVLGECVRCLAEESLALRLHSKLSLGLSHSVLLHYRQLLAEVQKLLRRFGSAPPAPGAICAVASARITHPLRLSLLARPLPGPAAVLVAGNDTIEYPRGHSSFLLPSSIAAVVPELRPRRAEKLDTWIEIRTGAITSWGPNRSNSPACPLASWILAILCPGTLPAELDISSIEVPRQHSSSLFECSAELSLSSLPGLPKPPARLSPERRAALSFFLSVLSGVTEGQLTADQPAPYGIIRVQPGGVTGRPGAVETISH